MRPYRTAIVLLGAMIALRSISDYGVGAFLPTIFASQGYVLLRAFAYTLIISGIQPLAQLFGGWFQDRVKERRTALWVTLWVGGLLNLAFALTIFFGGPIEVAVGFQVLATLIGGAYVAIYYTLGTELFPTSIRSAALGWETSIGRTGAVVGPLLLGLLATGLPFATILTFWYVPVCRRSDSLSRVARSDAQPPSRSHRPGRGRARWCRRGVRGDRCGTCWR